jgi:hypothetical protein
MKSLVKRSRVLTSSPIALSFARERALRSSTGKSGGWFSEIGMIGGWMEGLVKRDSIKLLGRTRRRFVGCFGDRDEVSLVPQASGACQFRERDVYERRENEGTMSEAAWCNNAILTVI